MRQTNDGVVFVLAIRANRQPSLHGVIRIKDTMPKTINHFTWHIGGTKFENVLAPKLFPARTVLWFGVQNIDHIILGPS